MVGLTSDSNWWGYKHVFFSNTYNFFKKGGRATDVYTHQSLPVRGPRGFPLQQRKLHLIIRMYSYGRI